MQAILLIAPIHRIARTVLAVVVADILVHMNHILLMCHINRTFPAVVIQIHILIPIRHIIILIHPIIRQLHFRQQQLLQLPHFRQLAILRPHLLHKHFQILEM